jgi:hypothetical protein
MASMFATAVGAYIGIAGITGIVDVVFKSFRHAKSFVQASKKVDDAIGRMVDICKNVQKLLRDNKAFAFPESIIVSVGNTLRDMEDIQEKYKNHTLRERIRHMPKALNRLNELDEVEKKMQTVLALIGANVAGEAFAIYKANIERAVQILAEQQESLARLLVSICTASTRIETEMSGVERVCG